MKIADIEMVIYKRGTSCIQDVLIKGADGVFRTQCRGLTFKEYVADKGDGYECMPFDEAVAEIEKFNTALYIQPFKEISAEDYDYALEVLPPQKWLDVEGVNIFRMCEYLTGNITAHYASYNDKYYFANRRTTDSYTDMAKEIKCVA